MNPFSLIPTPYLLLSKVIASVLLIIALWSAWNSFAGHYKDIGRAEIQEKWNKQQELDRQATIKRISENLVKESKAKQDFDATIANHDKQINLIRAQYDKLNQDKTLADSAITNWRDRLRLELAKSTNGLPIIPSAPEGSTANRQDSDAATLRIACQVTTLDYNALHDAWDKACLTFGCKE